MLDQLLYYSIQIKKRICLFVVEILETLDLHILGRPDGLAVFFPRLDTFKNQEKNFLKAVVGSSLLKDRGSKSFMFVSQNREDKQLLRVYFIF